LATATDAQISAAPPPYTTRLSLTRFRTTHRASCSARFASSMIWIPSAGECPLGSETQIWSRRDGDADHFIASSHKDRYSTSVCTLFDDQHLLFCRPECYLPHETSATKLVRCEILEAWHYSAIGRDSNQLQCHQPDLGQMQARFTSISGPPTHRTAGRSFCIRR